MSLSAKTVIGLWIISTAIQLLTCAVLIRRSLGKSWGVGIAGLALNAGKSMALMAVWWWAGFRAYSSAWTATRWLHWVAVLLLLLQALWALSRVWPQGKPFAVMVGSTLGFCAAVAAALQAGWIDWPGSIGAAVVASRSFSFSALLFIFWCGWVYRCLRVVTKNAELWRAGVQAALCIEIACLAVEAASQHGPFMVAAQLSKQTAYLAAAWWWWRMGAAGEAFVLPKASDMPDRAWRVMERWMEGEKRIAV